MGLISGLLTLPLAPVRGVAWIGEQVAAEAERETADETRVRRELARLELALELGQIGEDEFEEQEDLLLARLERARGEE
jgi:ADP-ribose pyrophosphatase YjhB (NUDIX family)